MKILLILLVVGLIIWKEIPSMIREKEYKEITAFSIILLLGTVYMCDWMFNLQLPNPTKGLTWLLQPFTVWLEKILM